MHDNETSFVHSSLKKVPQKSQTVFSIPQHRATITLFGRINGTSVSFIFIQNIKLQWLWNWFPLKKKKKPTETKKKHNWLCCFSWVFICYECSLTEWQIIFKSVQYHPIKPVMAFSLYAYEARPWAEKFSAIQLNMSLWELPNRKKEQAQHQRHREGR